MIVIDDNMLRLAKMQEALLKMSGDNKKNNLEKYCQIVTDIDKKAFSSLLDVLNQFNGANRSLEDELKYLEEIKDYYDQLYELQASFKNVSDTYGGKLKLSDLLQIDIDYIEKRKSAISGYLINKENISNNKEKILKLSEQLVEEEKNNKVVSDRLLDFEQTLRNNFINAEGRIVVDGELQYVSVVTDYSKLGYDFERLLDNIELLEQNLVEVEKEKVQANEKKEAAEFCYNTAPSLDSKQIYEEINKEFLQVKYKFIMLKILQLLANNYNEFDSVKEKRDNLLHLIDDRYKCLVGMGVRVSIDPFARTKVNEQLNVIESLRDNSKVINKLKKEIADLSKRVDLMIYQNEEYMKTINDVKEMFVSRISMSDIDVSSVEIDVSDYVDEKEILDNQVVRISDNIDKLNMVIIKQKAKSVIKRVNEMMNSHEQVERRDEVMIPELVIVSQPVIEIDEKEDKTVLTNSILDDLPVYTFETEEEFKLEDDDKVFEIENFPVDENKDVDKKESESETSIFATVDPFIEAPLFGDKTEDFEDNHVQEVKIDESIFPSLDFELENDVEDENVSSVDSQVKEVKINDEEFPSLELDFNKSIEIDDGDDEMQDTFWVTQRDEHDELSFDEQINALLSSEDNSKIKKLAA